MQPQQQEDIIITSSRQQDVNRLVARINSDNHKLTVIHGQSGVDTSSLLKVGLLPVLQQKVIGNRVVLPVRLQFYMNWVGALGRSLAHALEAVDNITLSSSFNSLATILEQLRQNAECNLLTVLIFDQFEQFFWVHTDKAQRQEFYDFLHECINMASVKLILAMREDYLHYLLEFNHLTHLEVINNDILDKNNRYYLGNFSLEEARCVIQSLTDFFQFYLEPALIDVLVTELARELQEVRPIELQVVVAQLQTEGITTLEQYRGCGSKEQLVQRYLENVIADCGLENRRLAKLVLYLLTDENYTRPLKTRAELERDLKAFAEVDKLGLILRVFVRAGLVSLVPETPDERYQLTHDYFISFIRNNYAD
jgi:hypothetical protein